jgi:hypothetical protein
MNTIKNILIAIMAIIIVMMKFQSCNLEKKNNEAVLSLLQLTQEKGELEKKVDEQGREISVAQNIILQKTNEIESQLKEIDELHTLTTKVQIRNRTVYNKIEVPLHDTLFIMRYDTIEAKSFEFNDGWLIMQGAIADSVLTFDSLSVVNKFNIEIGERKQGWFKKKEQVVYVRNANPHTKTDELYSYTLEDNKKWYQKDGLKIAGTAILTFLLVGL